MASCGFSVTAIDNMSSYWKERVINRHFHVLRDDITRPTLSDTFDLITCISVLEHIVDHATAIRSMARLLKPGGYMVLTFPYNDRMYVENVYKLSGAGYGKDFSFPCQVFSACELNSWLKDISGKVIKQEFYEVFSGELWSFGERICPPRKVNRDQRHQLSLILIQKE